MAREAGETQYGRWRRGTNVRLQGVDELQAALNNMLRATDDLSGAWRDIYHPAILKGAADFFRTEGDGKWRDLTDRYALYKAMRGGGTGLLVGTPIRKKFPRTRGSLRDSLTQPNHPYHILDLSPRWMRTGTRDPLANIHFTKKGVRARKPLDAKAPSMQEAFREAVTDHAKKYGQYWEGGAR